MMNICYDIDYLFHVCDSVHCYVKKTFIVNIVCCFVDCSYIYCLLPVHFDVMTRPMKCLIIYEYMNTLKHERTKYMNTRLNITFNKTSKKNSLIPDYIKVN